MSIENNIDNSQTDKILNSLLDLGYKEKGEDDFIIEILGEKTEDIKEIANQLNSQIRNIASYEIRRISTPITMSVVGVNSDGTINVTKPSDKDSNRHCWTHIPNPTIFQHLSVGDEVVLGYYEGEQKSNCWVMFAKVDESTIKTKSIYKDIEKLYLIDDNSKMLKQWLHQVVLDTYPDIETTGTDSQGNTYVYYVPHPTRVKFEKEMSEQWKEVKK